MKLAAIAKLIKADEYCKLYKVLYEESTGCDLYIGTKTTIFPLSGFPKAQNESELATLLLVSARKNGKIFSSTQILARTECGASGA